MVNNAFSQRDLSGSYLFDQTLLSSHDTESISATISEAIAYDPRLRYLQELCFCSNTPEIIGDKVSVRSCQGFSLFATKVDFNPHAGALVLKTVELFKRREEITPFLRLFKGSKMLLQQEKKHLVPKSRG